MNTFRTFSLLGLLAVSGNSGSFAQPSPTPTPPNAKPERGAGPSSTAKWVIITSNHEPGYHKALTVADLPAKYRPDGSFDGFDHNLIRYPLTEGATGPFAVANRPKILSDGTWFLEIDAAADWQTFNSPQYPFETVHEPWLLAEGTLTAVPKGFTGAYFTPEYKWKVIGGQHGYIYGLPDRPDFLAGPFEQQGPQSTFSLSGIRNELEAEAYRVGEGTNPAALDPTEANVSVTDLDPTVPSALPVKAKYKINWHTPHEWHGHVTSGYPAEVYPDLGYMVDTSGNHITSFEPNQTANVIFPAKVRKVWIFTKDGVNTFGMVVGTGAAIGGGLAAIGIFGTETLTGPPGWILMAATVTAGVTSFVAGRMPDPTIQPFTADYTKYKADMKLQKEVNDARASNANAYPGFHARCDDPEFVEQALGEIDRIEHNEYPFNGNDNDQYFSQKLGEMRWSVHGARLQFLDVFSGDEYDSQGYVGPITMHSVYPGSPEYVVNWSFTRKTPPSGGPGGGGMG